jgi:hypothetical protein
MEMLLEIIYLLIGLLVFGALAALAVCCERL